MMYNSEITVEYSEGLPETFSRLAEVFRQQVFELCADRETGEYLIPYMMNDALEYYFRLRDSVKTGEYMAEDAIVSVQMLKEEERYLIILRQETGNICTLIFRELEECAHCYQYHRIGHFWVKGQEHWRQLVYIIGTIYDKYEYFGERFCNREELEIMHLIRFAPFRKWSPVSESLEEQYPDAPEGLKLMEHLAREAEDFGYLKWLYLYKKIPAKWVGNLLGMRLLSPGRRKLYALIWKKVERASKRYPERDYGSGVNAQIEAKREEVHRKLLGLGFDGVYPYYVKEKMRITAAEEHPFTIMEWEDYRFRIRLMVSEAEEEHAGINAGFFNGRGSIVEWE